MEGGCIKQIGIVTIILSTLLASSLALAMDNGTEPHRQPTANAQVSSEGTARDSDQSSNAVALFEKVLLLEQLGRYEEALQMLRDHHVTIATQTEVTDAQLQIAGDRIRTKLYGPPLSHKDLITNVFLMGGFLLFVSGATMIGLSSISNKITRDDAKLLTDGNPLTGEFRQIYLDETTKQRTVNTAGFIITSVGAVVLGTGLLRVLADVQNVGVGVSADGVSGQVRGRF